MQHRFSQHPQVFDNEKQKGGKYDGEIALVQPIWIKIEDNFTGCDYLLHYDRYGPG